jgi:peptidyl-prolyl cis-trans isomerase C
MLRTTRPRWRLAGLLLLAALACDTQKNVPGSDGAPVAVVARVGERAITREALRAHLDARPAGAGAAGETNAARVAHGTDAASALEELIEQALLEEAARRRGIPAGAGAAPQPSADPAAAARGDAALRRRALLAQLAAEAQVSEAELRALHRQDPERFRTTRVRLRMIRTPDEETLEAAARRIEAGEDFARVAAEVNGDPALREAAGDLGPMTRRDVPADLRTAAFSLAEPGAQSPPFRTPSGWVLLRLEEREEGALQSFDAVRDALERELRRTRAAQAYARLLADLRRELGVTIDGAQLAALAPPAPPVRHAPVRPARASRE